MARASKSRAVATAPAKITVILEERGKTHGTFKDNAVITTSLRDIGHKSPNWDQLHPEQQLAFDESMLKWSRILSEGSDPDFREHYDDLAGYATLAGNACKGG